MERLTYFEGGKWRLRIGETECSGPAIDHLAAYEDKIPFDRLDEAAALVKSRDEGRVLPEGSGWFVTSDGKKLTIVMDINAAQEAEAALGGGGDGV